MRVIMLKTVNPEISVAEAGKLINSSDGGKSHMGNYYMCSVSQYVPDNGLIMCVFELGN